MARQTVPILDIEAIRQLAEDHRQLEERVRNTEWRLRAYMQLLADEDASPLKPWARATFDAAFTTSDASVAGTLQTQYGQGEDHANTSLTLFNLQTDVPTEYVFSGKAGGACWARYSGTVDEWLIVIPQCT